MEEMQKETLIALTALLGVSLFNLNRAIVKNLPKVKDGARVDGLKPEVDPALLAIESVAKRFGLRGFVTSGLDDSPNRLPNSLHREGLAVDARRVDWPAFDNSALARAQLTAIQDELGNDFDVVLEGNHIHIEFDPERIG